MAGQRQKKPHSSIPLALINTKVVGANGIFVYLWLVHFCNEIKDMWIVDYKTLHKLTGITVKNISLSINRLEAIGAIAILRNRGRISVLMLDVPDVLTQNMESTFAELALLDTRKKKWTDVKQGGGYPSKSSKIANQKIIENMS